MSNQKKINPEKRSVLVDWLFDIADDLKLQQQTLFLAVNYLDRYSSKKQVELKKYQLLGVVCLWLAAKMEEQYDEKLLIAYLLEMTKNSFTMKEVCIFESCVMFVGCWKSWKLCNIGLLLQHLAGS